MRSALLRHPAPDDLFADPLRARGARIEVCPPQALPRPWLARLRDWLTGGGLGHAPLRRAPPPARDGRLPLDAIRAEFIEAVDPIRTPAGEDLLDRIHFARNLRELWHLRAEIFRLVSLHSSQAEAAERLEGLNRHFPTRSPRSGFGALTTKDMWP